MSALLESRREPARLDEDGRHDDGRGEGSAEGRHVRWFTIADGSQAVVEGVERIRAHPLVLRDSASDRYRDDVRSGRLLEIPEATARGRADGSAPGCVVGDARPGPPPLGLRPPPCIIATDFRGLRGVPLKLSKLLSGRAGAQEVRLELARTYAELGAAELARKLLAEVREEGNRQQRALAEDLLAELA